MFPYVLQDSMYLFRAFADASADMQSVENSLFVTSQSTDTSITTQWPPTKATSAISAAVLSQIQIDST